MRKFKIEKQITDRRDPLLSLYLQDVGKEGGLISLEEEVELARRIKKGDEVAVEKLIKANLRFVVSVAKQYQNQGITLPDLINTGNLGLIKAARRFDETRGFKFISYAVWFIRQSILQGLNEQAGVITKKQHDGNIKSKVNRIIDKFEQEHMRKPVAEEITKILQETMNIDRETILDHVQRALNPRQEFRFDAPRGEGEDGDSYATFSQNMFSAPDEDVFEKDEKGGLFNVIIPILRFKIAENKDEFPAHLEVSEFLEIFLREKNEPYFRRNICDDFDITDSEMGKIVRFVKQTLKNSEYFKKEARSYGGGF